MGKVNFNLDRQSGIILYPMNLYDAYECLETADCPPVYLKVGERAAEHSGKI